MQPTYISNIGLYHAMYSRYIGVAPKKKVVRPIFFSEGVISRIFFRYMHKDKFLSIFSQIKSNAYYRCTWSMLSVFRGVLVTLLLLVFCVFSYSFCMLFVISVSVFFASSLSLDFPTFRFCAH